VRGEELVRCRYFELDRYALEAALPLPRPGRVAVWLVLDGAAELRSVAGGYRRGFRAGETVLVPASAEGLSFDTAPRATLLGVHLP
jgi:hypothetical protein